MSFGVQSSKRALGFLKNSKVKVGPQAFFSTQPSFHLSTIKLRNNYTLSPRQLGATNSNGSFIKNLCTITNVPKRWNTTTTTTTTTASETPPPEKPKAKRRFFKTKVFLGLYILVWAGDIILNDDVDTQLDRLRFSISDEERAKRPKIVILGTGWGALSMIRKLRADQFDVTVIAPRNYFLFTPLLPSTCGGYIDVRCIVEPIRDYCRRCSAKNVNFYEAECINIDAENNKVTCKRNSQGFYREIDKACFGEFEVDYDYLVVAVGTESATFGIPGVKEHALFMKEGPDGKRLRGRIIDSLETANMPGSEGEEEKNRLLNFVVVGGGPTGIECAAELHDLVQREVKLILPHLVDKINITLIEALPHVLSMFNPALVSYTEEKFKREGITTLTRNLVTKVDEDKVYVKDLETGEIRDIPYGTLLWASGVATRPVVRDLMKAIGPEKGQTSNRALCVDNNMRVMGQNNIFALGDCAFMNLAPTAQVAAQQGTYLGRLLRKAGPIMNKCKIENDDKEFEQYLKSAEPFEYRHYGMFAYLGGHEALADFTNKGEESNAHFAGMSTYFLWRSVYFTKLLSFRNRTLLFVNWAFSEIFGRDTSRR